MCLGPEIALLVQTIGTVAATAGAGVGAYSSIQAGAASEKAEKLRRKQMENEVSQRKRAAIREFQLKRATTLSNIQGATGTLENSAAGGAVSGLGATLGTQIGEIDQAASIGRGIYDANADYAEATAMGQTASSVGNFGKSLFSSADEIGRLGASYGSGKSLFGSA